MSTTENVRSELVKALQAFEDTVIDRLFVLNEIRAQEEAAAAKKAPPQAKAPKKPSKKPSKKKPGPPPEAGGSQGSLF